MKKMIIYIAVAAVILAFSIGFRWYGAAKRKKEKQFTDPNKMTRAKITKSFNLENALTAEHKQSITNLFKQSGGRITEGDNDSLIVYTGNAAQAKYGGMLNVEPVNMPLRFIFLPSGNQTQVHIDEDFGFHMFMGFAKSAFDDKYKEALEYWEGALRNGL